MTAIRICHHVDGQAEGSCKSFIIKSTTSCLLDRASTAPKRLQQQKKKKRERERERDAKRNWAIAQSVILSIKRRSVLVYFRVVPDCAAERAKYECIWPKKLVHRLYVLRSGFHF
jgi:hypothetical protein